MSDSRRSPEIVTQQELDPVLKSTKFDSVEFLRLYNEWNVTKDIGTFASLRTMHENAGYNNKNVVFGAEQEMHQIAAIVQKYQDSKNVVTTTAAAATSDVRQTVPSVPVQTQEITEESIRKQSGDIRKSLDAMTMENLESSLKLTESLTKLIPSTHATLGRGVVGSMMLGRLHELGYSLSIDANNTVLVRSNNKDVLEVKNKINAFAAVQGSSLLDTIRIGTLYMSPTFREYAASNMVDGKVVISKTPADYGKYLELKQSQDTKKDPIVSDLNFIDSLKSGGYNGFDFTQAMVQSQGLGKVAQFIDSNPAVAGKIATAMAPLATSAGSPSTNPAGSATSSPSQQPATTAGKAAGVVGEGVGAVAGGIGAIVGNVASETASTWSTILSEATKSGGAFGAIGVIGLVIASIWKFGFGKTMLGIIGVGGASAIANAAENGTFDKLAGDLKKGAKKAGEVAEEALEGGKAAVASGAAAVTEATSKPAEKKEEFLESPTQKKISDKIRNSEEFKGILDPKKLQGKRKNADINAYLLFINKELASKPVDIFLRKEVSVFLNKTILDSSIILPQNMDPMVFKSVMRMYITGTYMSVVEMDKPENVSIIKEQISKKPEGSSTLQQTIEKIHN